MRYKSIGPNTTLFLPIFIYSYISMFPPPNASDSITYGLLVKKRMEKCPKTWKTIKYESTYALRGPARELQQLTGIGDVAEDFTRSVTKMRR